MQQMKEKTETLPKLIVMLTYKDQTVENAFQVFESCKNSKAEYFGFKEMPLPLEEMKRLFAYMKACGKKTVLEVVEYTEKEGLEGAKMAAYCGCDILMGTCYFPSIHEYCREHEIKYMPFIGQIQGRPSILTGTWQEMAEEAEDYYQRGACGCDLLGYRYKGDASKLNRMVVSHTDAPICIAGSVNSYERLDEIISMKAWGFTIGSAFFEKRFGEEFAAQIDTVYDYVEKKAEEING